MIHETSPYLLQHAHNPVNWYPWGEEALRLAREQNKPIFLSIGYAACHWCHVMEHESFEDEHVAEILSEHFLSIKVDREERPDLDDIYMNATVLFTQGHGGWPMSVWLTPDGKPFFAGTYFPPEDNYGRPGFSSVLLMLEKFWRERRDDLLSDAGKVAGMLGQMEPVGSRELLSDEQVAGAAAQIAGAFDDRNGGLGSGQNKFPPSMAMDLILRNSRTAPSHQMTQPVELTLEKMARGGIYDHLGGGIARYSTDVKWLVPHFEKMLYDQALVSSIYLDGYVLFGREDFAATARGIFDYVLRQMQSPEGGFYSSEDADSEGMEGKFYIWTWEEVLDVLGDEDGALFASVYDVTAMGNWDHPGDAHVPSGAKNILQLLRPMAEAARQHGLPVEDLELRMAEARRKLFEVREKRVHPGLDDKVLTAWNGLMIASLAKGAAILAGQADGKRDGETNAARYRVAVERAADFILTKMQKDGRLLRSYRAGKAHLMAYVDDYAFLIDGLTCLYELTGELRWLAEAERLMDTALEHYWDPEQGGFFFTAADHEQLIVRAKPGTDNAIPSGNSVMAMNAMRLAVLLGRPELRERAGAILELYGGAAGRQPFAHDRMLSAMEAWHEGFAEIAIVGPADDAGTRELVRAAWGSYLPNKVVALLDPALSDAGPEVAPNAGLDAGKDAAPEAGPDAGKDAGRPNMVRVENAVPLLAGKKMVDGKAAAYVCRDYACQAPVTTGTDLATQLTPTS